MKPLLSRFVLFLFLLFVASSFLYAQSGKVPPFRMMQANGKIFRAQDLPMGKPILLIYFSPECDHCEKIMKAFFGQAGNFQKASVAFITFLPVDNVSKFAKDYNLVKHPNMYAGTEGSTYFVRNYYRIKELPFTALYTKNGDIVTSFEKDVNLTSLAQKLKQLE
jgi:thioredoxin-related protein